MELQKGFFSGDMNVYLDKIVQESGELSLLAKGDGTEVMLQKIKANETVFIYPNDIVDAVEYFLILEGSLEVIDAASNHTLRQGDYFFTRDLGEIIQFNTLTQVTVLYVSSQPVFHFLSESVGNLIDLAKKVQAKDIHTHSHIRRVKDYAVKIGNRLDLAKGQIEKICFSSLFHDVGKINVPDSILNKPGKLTAEEYELIKKHPADGVQFVKTTYYARLAEIIEQHHERLDGSGYPRGLKGGEISLEARIIAVADSYDAMTSDRAYRKAMQPCEAMADLLRLKGIHYDEKVVDTLASILHAEGHLPAV